MQTCVVVTVSELTIDHMLLECAVWQKSRDEFYTADSLNMLFETVPETCIVEYLWDCVWFEWSDFLYNSSLESSPNCCNCFNFN